MEIRLEHWWGRALNATLEHLNFVKKEWETFIHSLKKYLVLQEMNIH